MHIDQLVYERCFYFSRTLVGLYLQTVVYRNFEDHLPILWFGFRHILPTESLKIGLLNP